MISGTVTDINSYYNWGIILEKKDVADTCVLIYSVEHVYHKEWLLFDPKKIRSKNKKVHEVWRFNCT
jgi:hypothetical protein